MEENFRRVFLVWNYIEWGGAQIYFLSIIKNAPRRWRFTIVLPRNSKPDIINFFAPYGVEFDFLPEQATIFEAETLHEKLTRQRLRIEGEWRIYRHLLGYDLENSVVHIEAAPWQSWILLYLLTLKGNVFVTMHNRLPERVSPWRKAIWTKRLNFLLSRKKFHCFCANQNAIESLKKFAAPRYWNKLILTRASIDPAEIERASDAEFDRAATRRKFGLPEDKFIVLCVGQFIDRKGRWIYLETVRETAKSHENIFFVWLTPQTPTEAEQKKIDEFDVKNNFRLVLSETVGVKHDEVLRFFRVADVFALPSLWEGLPISVLEAMALGIPTVSTDINAIPEAIKHLETGILIEPGAARNLTEAILLLYDDENLRNKLSENGRGFVLENFDERIAGRVVVENYEKCLAN